MYLTLLTLQFSNSLANISSSLHSTTVNTNTEVRKQIKDNTKNDSIVTMFGLFFHSQLP
jgi:hypothetical protein